MHPFLNCYCNLPLNLPCNLILNAEIFFPNTHDYIICPIQIQTYQVVIFMKTKMLQFLVYLKHYLGLGRYDVGEDGVLQELIP